MPVVQVLVPNTMPPPSICVLLVDVLARYILYPSTTAGTTEVSVFSTFRLLTVKLANVTVAVEFRF